VFSRRRVAEAAQELADHLKLIEHVKALQTGQKEIAEAPVKLGDRLRGMEREMSVLKAETRLEALREAQSVVYAVQGNLHQRLEDLAVRIATAPPPRIGSRDKAPQGPS
jgi:cell fate (sporulation/competence/biofilm development) regulator YmcA (YheA/YmcA/DUF963 family)